MDWFKKYQDGLPYQEFLTKFGTADQMTGWGNYRAQVQLSDSQLELLKSFSREIHVLCMAGVWCGDCVQQCPIFDVFEEAASTIHIRYVDRDEDAELKEALTICGGARVPQVVFFNEDGQVLGRNGDRTLSRYRAMAATQIGAACPTGILGDSGDPVLKGVVQDWLNEFERMHLICRLSPRLRQKHND